MPLPEVGLQAVLQGLDQFERGARSIENAYDRLDKGAGTASKSSSAFSRLLGGLGRGVLDLGATMAKVAAGGVAALGAGLTALAVSSIGVAADFESQIAILGTAVDPATASLHDLQEAALAVGADTSLVGVSASQAAEAMTGLYKAGLTTNDIFGDLQGYLSGTTELSGALRAAVDLQAASELDLAEASDIVAIAMATFGLDADEATRISNNFVQAADASVASVSDLREAMKNVGPTAAAFGFSLEDTNNALALLSTRGITGAEAGTALKSMLTNMMRPTKQVRKAMDELGVSLYNADGTMRELPEILADLEKGMAGLTEEQKNQYIMTIAGTYGMKALQTLMEEGTGGWYAMAAATAEAGTASEIAAARTETFQGAMEALSGTVETLKIRIGSALLPVLTELARRFANFINTYGPKLTRLFESLADKVQTVVSAFDEGGLSGALQAAGRIITDLGKAIYTNLISAWPLIAAALRDWGARFWNWLTGEGGAISLVAQRIGAFANSIVMAVVEAWPAIWESLRTWAANFWNWLTGEGGALSQAGQKIGEMATSLANIFTANWPIVWGALKTWATSFWDWLTGPEGALAAAGAQAIAAGTAIGDRISKAWVFVWPALLEWSARFWDWLVGPGGVIESASDYVNAAANTLGQAFADHWPIIQARLFAWAKNFWDWLTGEGGAIDRADVEMDKIAERFSAWVDDNTELFQTIGERIADGILLGIVALVTSAKFSAKVSDAFVSISDSFAEIGRGIATGVLTGFIENLTGWEIPAEVQEGIRSALEKAFAVSPLALGRFLLEQLQNIFTGVKELFELLPGVVEEASAAFEAMTLPDWLTPGSETPLELALANIALSLQTTLPTAFTTFVTTVTTSWPAVQEMVTRLETTLTSVYSVTLPALGAAATTTGTAIVTAFQDSSDKIVDVLIPALDDLVDKLGEVGRAAQRAADAVSKVGSTAPAGPIGAAAFQAGGSFIVPPGFGPETHGFPMTVHSGELVNVLTRQQLVNGPITPAMAAAAGRGGGGRTVNVYIGDVNIGNEMDMQTFTARVRRAVAEGL